MPAFEEEWPALVEVGVDDVGAEGEDGFGPSRPNLSPVGAENYVISCDLRILAGQAADPVPAQNPDAHAQSRRMRAASRRPLLQCRCRRWRLQ